MSGSDNYRILVHASYAGNERSYRDAFKLIGGTSKIVIEESLENLFRRAEIEACDAIIINPCIQDYKLQCVNEQQIKSFIEKGAYKSRGNPAIFVVLPCETSGYVTEYPKDVVLTFELSPRKLLEDVRAAISQRQPQQSVA